MAALALIMTSPCCGELLTAKGDPLAVTCGACRRIHLVEGELLIGIYDGGIARRSTKRYSHEAAVASLEAWFQPLTKSTFEATIEAQELVYCLTDVMTTYVASLADFALLRSEVDANYALALPRYFAPKLTEALESYRG